MSVQEYRYALRVTIGEDTPHSEWDDTKKAFVNMSDRAYLPPGREWFGEWEPFAATVSADPGNYGDTNYTHWRRAHRAVEKPEPTP